jgi:hypothetical protein
MSPLLARLDVLIASCTAPSTRDDDLRRTIEQAEARYTANANRGRQSAQAIFDAKHREIAEAWGGRALYGEIDARKIGICLRSMELLGYSVDRRTARVHVERLQSEL